MIIVTDENTFLLPGVAGLTSSTGTTGCHTTHIAKLTLIFVLIHAEWLLYQQTRRGDGKSAGQQRYNQKATAWQVE